LTHTIFNQNDIRDVRLFTPFGLTEEGTQQKKLKIKKIP
jgi:hypothetical protein